MKAFFGYYKWLLIGSFASGFLISEYCRMSNASGTTRMLLLFITGIGGGLTFNIWKRNSQK